MNLRPLALHDGVKGCRLSSPETPGAVVASLAIAVNDEDRAIAQRAMRQMISEHQPCQAATRENEIVLFHLFRHQMPGKRDSFFIPLTCARRVNTS